MTTSAEIETFLQEIRRHLPAVENHRADVEARVAPRLSAFHLLDPNEVGISRVIADLLNPRGMHGQEMLFLNTLLPWTGLPLVDANERVRVTREDVTGEGRRIDIVVDMPRSLLGIENKPWAGQQDRQLSDYVRELNNRARGRPCVLLFLSDQEAKTASKEVLKLPLHADQGSSLSALLRSTLSAVRAEKTKAFVGDFVEWLEVQCGGATLSDPISQPYVELIEAQFDGSPANQRAIAATMLAQARIHARVLDRIGNYIIRGFRERFGAGAFSAPSPSLQQAVAEQYGAWQLRRDWWPTNCALSLEAQSKNYCGIVYGVWAPRTGDQACPERARLDEILRAVPQGRKSAWWPWYRSAEEPNWTPEFVARLILETDGEIERHPEVDELLQRLVALAEVLDSLGSARGAQP